MSRDENNRAIANDRDYRECDASQRIVSQLLSSVKGRSCRNSARSIVIPPSSLETLPRPSRALRLLPRNQYF